MKLACFLVLVVMTMSCGNSHPPSSKIKPLTAAEKLTIGQCAKNGEMVLRNKNQDIIACADSCAEFKKTIPKDWFQDTIEVPEDPKNPEGQKIKVFYYGKITPGQTPTVFFNGGPGSDSHYSSKSLRLWQKQRDPHEKISWVFIDQRGNGCSDFFPQGNSEESISRLSHYGSDGIVADAEVIRKKLLGNKPWIAFGQSFGGYITHRYFIEHPRSLKAGFSHGNTINSDGYLRIKNRIRSQIRLKDEYFKVYPEDKKIVDRMVSYLEKGDCVEDPEGLMPKVCGYNIVMNLMQWMGFKTDWESVHAWIEFMWSKDTDDLEWGALERFVVDYMSYENPKNLFSTADKVISWVDRNIEMEDLKNCRRIQKELLTEDGIDLTQDALNECAGTLQLGGEDSDTLAPYRHLPQNKLQIADLLKSLDQNPAVPLYVYSGELDPFLPKETFVEEVAAVGNKPNFHYTHFMESGHEGFKTEQKVWDDILANLANLP